MNRSYYRPLEYRQRYWPTDYYFVNNKNRLQEIEDFNDYKNLIYRLMMQKQKQQREMELAKYIKKQEEMQIMYQEEMRKKKQEEIRRKQLEEMKKREEIERKKLNDEIMKYDEEYARKLQEEEYKKVEKVSIEEENSNNNWKPQEELIPNLEISNEIEDELPEYIEPDPIVDDAQSADPVDLLKFDD